MSSAIIKFENEPEKLIYWKDHAYPTGLGFKLLSYYNDETNDLYDNKDMFEIVTEIPKDIQYEYIVKTDHTIHCQESWFTPDKNYHGGGIRHGGIYDLVELKKKVELQEKYTTRREEDWNDKPIEQPKWKFIIKKYDRFNNKYHSDRQNKDIDGLCKCSDIIEYETDNVEICKDIIIEFMDIVESKNPIDDEWIKKEYINVDEDKFDCIKRYYNGRLEIYNKMISDIDNYLKIVNDTRRDTVFHYDIPYELNHFETSDQYKDDSIQEESYLEIKITI